LPFIKLDPSEKQHHPSTSTSTSTTADEEKPTSSNNDNIADQSKNTWINTLVGTSMLAWYFGGEEGISNVWHFLTSSS